MAAAAMACCSMAALAQRNACDLPVKGAVEAMTIVVRDGKGNIESRETAQFDAHGRLLERKIQHGSMTTNVKCEYDKERLVRAISDHANPGERTVTEFSYSPEGLLLEADEKNAAGVLMSRTLSDPLREMPPAIDRTFQLHLSAPAELNDRTEIDENDPHTSITHLMVNNKEAAIWRIERDPTGRVVRDEVTYEDLSFSQREFHPDGSSFEHEFDAASGLHSFFWRGRDGRLMKEARSSKPEILYSYTQDQHGNWTEMAEKQRGTTAAITTRNIQYW
jgi:hypothetical protein